MSEGKPKVPAIEGWFTLDPDNPRLLGQREVESGTYFFPKDVTVSQAPGFADAEREDVELSRRGKLWSYTTNYYKPPAPYVSPEPFEPYTVAAVELNEERMVVLGQLAPGVEPDSLEVGMDMELVLGTLYEDDDKEVIIWKWKPVAA